MLLIRNFFVTITISKCVAQANMSVSSPVILLLTTIGISLAGRQTWICFGTDVTDKPIRG